MLINNSKANDGNSLKNDEDLSDGEVVTITIPTLPKHIDSLLHTNYSFSQTPTSNKK